MKEPKQTILPTERLDLVMESTASVLARIDALPPEHRAQVSPDWLAQLKAADAADPWTHGFAMVERTGGATIGSCGYKGPPDENGVVEIAYAVDDAQQGRGYATEAAQALVRFAFQHAGVKIVRAHTLPTRNASTRILEKCGFEFLGEVVDPEDGPVWRWEQESSL
jgi:ribosomal-protein-alanine N-acetyltransferase